MFTPSQRIYIIKWSSVGLLGVSFIPVIVHGLFYFPIVQQYLQLGIIGTLIYFGYKKSKEIWKA